MLSIIRCLIQLYIIKNFVLMYIQIKIDFKKEPKVKNSKRGK